MARASRDSRLDNRTQRLKLAKGKRHYAILTTGLALAYRRTGEGYGTWSARILDKATNTYSLKKIGAADDFTDADGVKVFDYFQAQEKCRELAKAESPADTGITVAKAVENYMAWYRTEGKAVKETETTINAHILPYFGESRISDLTTKAIREWHHKLANKPARKRTRSGARQQYQEKPDTEDKKRARKATANRVLTVLKAILNRAYDDDAALDKTIWSKVKPFKNTDEPVIRFLTQAEAIRLTNACRADFRLLVRGALYTGARYTELASMLSGHFHPTARNVYIQPSKSGKSRHVPLSAEGFAFFEELATGKTGKKPLFTKQDETVWGKNHQVRLLKEACKQAKIEPEITFHDLRHTYASLLAQHGADLLTISKLLGHADTRITARHYAHLCDKTLANAVNALLPGFGFEPDKKVKALR